MEVLTAGSARQLSAPPPSPHHPPPPSIPRQLLAGTQGLLLNPAPREVPGTLALVSRELGGSDGRGTKGTRQCAPPQKKEKEEKQEKKKVCRRAATGASLPRLFCRMTSRWQRKSLHKKGGRQVSSGWNRKVWCSAGFASRSKKKRIKGEKIKPRV